MGNFPCSLDICFFPRIAGFGGEAAEQTLSDSTHETRRIDVDVFWQMLKFCQKSREPKATVSSNEITRIDPHTWSGRKWHGSDANGGRAGHSTCRRAFCANFNAFYAAEKIRALRRELGERIPISTSTKRPRQPAIPRSASPTRLEHRKCSGLGVAPAGEGISLDKLFPPSRFLLGGPVQRVVHSTTTVG